MAQFQRRTKIAVLYHAGIAPQDIWKRLPNVSKATVYRTIQKIKDGESINHRKGAGRPIKLSEEERARLRTIASQNPPYSSAVNLAADLTRHGIEISNRSTIRYLHRAGFSNLLPRKVLFLTEAHVTKRLEWCQRRRHDSWQNTIFTDECTFQLFRNSLRIWVPADRDPVYPAPKHGPKVNVWGGISARGLMVVKLFSENLDLILYQSILEECLFETADALYPDGCRLQHDNAPAHRSKRTKDFLADRLVDVIDWPANSPDLSPIENLWSWLKHEVERKRPMNKAELEAGILDVWEGLATIDIENYFMHYDSRISQCIDNGGGRTKY